MFASQCRTCFAHFTSNNKLHHHLRKDNCKHNTPFAHTIITASSLPPTLTISTLSSTSSSTPASTSLKLSIRKVIESTVNLNQEIGTGYGFRGWKHTTGIVSFYETEDSFNPESCCFDSGAGITLVDREFFRRQAGHKISICTMATPITVRGIGITKHATDEYAIVPFMFEGTQKEQSVLAKFWREVYLVDNLKANLLIGIDIMGPELVVVDMGRKRVILGSCDVEVSIEIKFRSHSAHGVIRPILAQKTTVVPPHSASPICIHHLHQIPADRDYLFEPGDVNFGVYTHMVNSETSTVLVQNDSHNSLHIPRNFRLGHIVELECPNAFTAEPTELADLALRQPKSHHKASWF